MQKLQKLKRIVSLIIVFFFFNFEKGREKKRHLKWTNILNFNFCNFCKMTNIPLAIAFYAAEVAAEVEISAEVELLHGGQNELP